MKKYLILFFAIFAITACDSRLSTNDLSEIESMYESEFFTDIEIDSLILEIQESNKYTAYNDGSYVYTVQLHMMEHDVAGRNPNLLNLLQAQRMHSRLYLD